MALTMAMKGCPGTLKADLEILLSREGESQARLSGGLRAAWPDRIRLQARAGPFVPVLSMAIDADSAFISLPRAGSFWRGVWDGVDESLPIPGAADLLAVLCPAPLFELMHDPILDKTPGGWTLRGPLGEREAQSWLEARLSEDCTRVTELLWRDNEGTIRLRAWRYGSRRVGAAAVPQRIRIGIPQAKRTVEIRFSNLREDTEQPAGLFRLMPGPGQHRIDDDQLQRLVEVAHSP